MSDQGAKKFDAGKIPVELISPIALLAIAKVLGFGAKKYAPNNWRLGLAWMRIIGAIIRHLVYFALGQDLDPESGLPHVDHAACGTMFLCEMYRTRKDLDNRFKYSPEVTEALLREFNGIFDNFVAMEPQENKSA